MKKKKKYQLIKYAIDEYGKEFNYNYKRMDVFHKQVKELLSKYKHSSMCEWSYCCDGLYHNCWQEPFFRGNWGLTQKQVDEIIYETVRRLAKKCRRDSRIACYSDENSVHIVMIARDLPEYRADYLFTFTNER